MIRECFKIFPVIETDRLILREITPNDVDSIFEIYGDPEVAKYDYFYPLESKEKVLEYISRFKKEFEEQEEITWGIVLKENNTFVGTCNFGNFEQYANRCEIGYCIMQKHWNKGYATDAVRRIVEFGFENMNLNRIEAFITPGNDGSVKVLKKVEFTEEGLVRERDYIKGKLEDGIILAILKRDYEKVKEISNK